MSLQAELPSSKAKREQALRSILAARRRQILSQRPIESRNLNRTPRPIEVSAKDPPDVLEAQETRHGMYVTAPASNTKADEETPSGIVVPELSSKNVDIEFVSKDQENKQTIEEQTSRRSSGENLEDETFHDSSKGNDSITNTDSSSSLPSTTSSTLNVNGQKSSDSDVRKKNIVSMPDSLYNYFRPVESNIPVEDMSQFLYFGQKIQPEIQNTTGNNSVESTVPTVPTASSSRRRYSMKRFTTTTTTTPVPVPMLEEIVNEEMNIAVERQTVEKNKVSKIKNAYRSPENGVYYRKSRPTDSTITSNVIASKETGGNCTAESEARIESSGDKFRDDNPSAHADTLDQQLRHGRGSAAAHVLAETRNATNSTQIPYQQPVSANMYERTRTESEIGFKDRPADASNERIDLYSINDELSKKTEAQSDQPRTTNSRESNNIETSTSRDKIGGRSTTEPFRIVWTSPETSTLRIIVTEGGLEESFAIGADAAEKYTVKPVDSTEERVRGGSSSSSSVASGDVPTPWVAEHVEGNQDSHRHRQQKQHHQHHQHQEQQQQHVYAYTITNVTRLLRNYTGPGLSREEQGGPERSTGTTEITTGSAQRRQPPPPSLLLPRAGSGIEAGRAPAELSAGTAVEAVAAGGASAAAHLVGERQRKVVTATTPQSQQQRAVNRTSPLQLTSVNKSGARSAKLPTEVNSRGAVRWNHTKSRSTDLEGFNDRRLLRKSASAVLNQRIGGNVDEEAGGSSVIGKRRRLTNGQSGFFNRRVKGTKIIEEGSSVLNGSVLINDKRNLTDEKNVDDAAEGRGFRETAPRVDVNRSLEGSILENMTAESVTMQQRIVPTTIVPFPPSAEETIETTTGQQAPVNTTDEDGGNLTEMVTSPSGRFAETDTKDQSIAFGSENESVPVSESSNAFDGNGADNGTENGSGSPTVTVTATTVDETIVPKETTTTPIPPPVFPVTPRMITEAVRAPIDKETFTLKPTDSVNQMTDIKTIDANKPLDMANLDPSEIQKMYRSKDSTTTTIGTTTSSTTTEPPTTISMTTVQIEISTIPQDQSTTSDTKGGRSETFTIPPIADPRKRVSSERSPEVRGRNLSDKPQDSSSDKDDDVLPIMHLYNTSDIFNGSGPMNSFSRGMERRMELPVKQPETSRTTEKANDTATTAKSSPTNESNFTRVPETTRKDKHEENRETTTQVPPTGPGRGYTNGSGNNRTRHRPIYHPAILPEYNSSVYPNELNRTLFETGLISVSPRESVNISEVISKRHDGDAIASQETVAVVSYILATLVVFPIAVGVGLILRRLILRNRKVLEESDTSSEISCRKDALNLENGDFKTSIEKAITKLPRIQHLCHEAEKPPPPSSQESRWEFPRDKLRLQTVLGQGNFGQVWKAEADDLTGHQGTTRLVAVKTVKEGASEREKEDLVRELEIMQQLGSHPNVVTLLGCCTEQEPHYLILEYVMYGKLLAYLRDHRTRQDFYNFSEDSAALTSRDLTVFGYCVARGMEYLASKKIIHRDLAARNVLVDHNKLCKIADFGMSRFANEDGEVIETRHGRNALPIRWMAPESLLYSLFTTKTDVWSFGILMWEIVTLGSTPYPDMTAREVMRNVQNGYRLERPSHCRSELFRVISRCWHADPDRRPEFQTLRRDLAQLLEDNMNGHYVDLESFASECTD
ncbi:Tyrosine kinase receptor Cad96Ca [Habropoda laboriosa]|uniref:receptor protein-tyrosine kinase n=1 Tax=Habropoda laboriosa TaxID=597456 RepID=A0A0L7R063_9HYME|nr:Tyrosine kinase receptor Cad96Ca [Habropoda laboriosa]